MDRKLEEDPMDVVRCIARLAVILGLGLSPLAGQQTHGDSPRHVREAGRMEGMDRRLKLTEAQRKAIQDIRAKHHDALKAARRNSAEARRAFREAIRNPSTPVDQLRALHGAMASKQFETILARREMRIEIRQVLTPEQREQAAHERDGQPGRTRHRRQDPERGEAELG